MGNNFISIIIAAGRPGINEVLDSLCAQSMFSDNYEIIVVSDIINLKYTLKPGVIFIPADTSNPAIKRNKGALSAKGDILAFIDDDAKAPENWLNAGLRALLNNPDYCGVGGPNLLPPNAPRGEKLTDLVLNFPILGSGHSAYSGKSVARKAELGEIHLCNLFVLKSVFQSVGGLNENIGYGGEDTEFIYQVKQKLNKDFIYSSDVFVLHHRRPFGKSYIKQRFKLRTNNGRLTLAYPTLYTRNPMFVALIVAGCALIPALIIHPILIPIALALYLIPVCAYVTAKHRDFFPSLVFALLTHHIIYAAGVFYGLISGVVRLKKTLAIRR